MLPETVELLRSRGFLRGEETADRSKIAVACHALVFERPFEATEQEIQEKALLVPDFRFRLFGDVDGEVEAELNGILGPLTGPKGPVQFLMENGYVLCSAPVERQLSNGDGGTITITRQGRFVTMNPDLIVRYFWQPAHERIITTVKGLNERFEIGIKRQPALAAQKPAMIGKTYDWLALEMPRQP
jgi:hypothetical protein